MRKGLSRSSMLPQPYYRRYLPLLSHRRKLSRAEPKRLRRLLSWPVKLAIVGRPTLENLPWSMRSPNQNALSSARCPVPPVTLGVPFEVENPRRAPVLSFNRHRRNAKDPQRGGFH